MSESAKEGAAGGHTGAASTGGSTAGGRSKDGSSDRVSAAGLARVAQRRLGLEEDQTRHMTPLYGAFTGKLCSTTPRRFLCELLRA